MNPRPETGGRDVDLLVVGDINPDIVVLGGDPQFGQREVFVESIALTIGGSASIVAAGAARLGLRVALVGVVGDDAFGRSMLDALAARGVDVSHCVITSHRPTGATVVLVRGSDRAILTATGTMADLGADAVTGELLARARHVHIGGLYLQSRLRAGAADLVTRIHDAGATVSLDTNWDPSGTWDGGVRALLPDIDILLPNEVEALRLARRSTVDAAARALQSGRRPLVVVKRAAAGALAIDADGALTSIPAMPVDVVDSTGAGDAFDAGFLAAWLEGRGFRDCLRYAAACGALSTRAIGGVDGQPTRAEVEAALLDWPDG
jgi:sugar/nucleoside kinase (ribokinase family)